MTSKSNNTQLIDANGTCLTVECRPSDIRIRMEARDGHEVLFYATAGDVTRLIRFVEQARPLPPRAIEGSFEFRRIRVPEGYEIVPLPLRQET